MSMVTNVQSEIPEIPEDVEHVNRPKIYHPIKTLDDVNSILCGTEAWYEDDQSLPDVETEWIKSRLKIVNKHVQGDPSAAIVHTVLLYLVHCLPDALRALKQDVGVLGDFPLLDHVQSYIVDRDTAAFYLSGSLDCWVVRHATGGRGEGNALGLRIGLSVLDTAEQSVLIILSSAPSADDGLPRAVDQALGLLMYRPELPAVRFCVVAAVHWIFCILQKDERGFWLRKMEPMPLLDAMSVVKIIKILTRWIRTSDQLLPSKERSPSDDGDAPTFILGADEPPEPDNVRNLPRLRSLLQVSRLGIDIFSMIVTDAYTNVFADKKTGNTDEIARSACLPGILQDILDRTDISGHRRRMIIMEILLSFAKAVNADLLMDTPVATSTLNCSLNGIEVFLQGAPDIVVSRTVHQATDTDCGGAQVDNTNRLLVTISNELHIEDAIPQMIEQALLYRSGHGSTDVPCCVSNGAGWIFAVLGEGDGIAGLSIKLTAPIHLRLSHTEEDDDSDDTTKDAEYIEWRTVSDMHWLLLQWLEQSRITELYSDVSRGYPRTVPLIEDSGCDDSMSTSNSDSDSDPFVL